jgi:hypothetical protein
MKTNPDPLLDLGPQYILIRIWMDKKTEDDTGVILNLSIWYENDKQRRAGACAKT